MDPFADLIKELGDKMGISLQPDQHQSCRLEFFDQVTLQLDLDSTGERILVGAQLGQLEAGSYREKILEQAMKVNGLLAPPRGILAYSEKNDALVLFQYLPLYNLTGEKLFEFLETFHEHALVWKTALEHGEVPEIEAKEVTHSGFFGLKP